ncbi:MAG: SsrA-binding protein SmpB [Bacilli bacterium]|jgi:ssrA-binding protein|nr:SsrA-binding protein SmpB [Bacilli bacterium]
MEILNRKARFNYFIIEEIECGIELFGSEVKSIRNGNCNIKDSYGVIRNNEVYLINMFIKNYKEASIFNKEETRKRKLLLHKKEIIKLKEKIEKEGYTLVPLKVYFNRNKVKVLLGLCKGKKTYDKREVLKEKEIKRKIEREIKSY